MPLARQECHYWRPVGTAFLWNGRTCGCRPSYRGRCQPQNKNSRLNPTPSVSKASPSTARPPRLALRFPFSRDELTAENLFENLILPFLPV
ncbi:hypothetical protein EVAR_84029_1 [Eumeta japonica]|uniref:Uncharacterized protein n=1 Tax=Eumeta variegata TaxID=151549 RepID=A0A4C1X917_EUMVA|nr:hypothetical protein EVAR_84029_1 [Eumeta japonica]